MVKQILVILLIFVLIIFNHTARGVSAFPYPIVIIQPDGTKITIIQKGDEHVKWAQTIDGYSIIRNKKGLFEYAKPGAGNDMVLSGIRTKNLSERTSSDNQFLKNINKALTYSNNQVRMMKSLSVIKEKSSQNILPVTGHRKMVCILIGFTDKAFTKTKADFENLFNQVGYNTDGATGSVHDYYKENSFNQLDVSVSVVGPYTASHNMSYYGANDGINNDVNPKALISEAITLADPDINYADFDNDNNGSVDGVYVIYAGYGEEAGGSPDALWSHSWSISPVTLDGKNICKYSCSSELRDNKGEGLSRIGVICHELGHTFGATDFYDSDYSIGGQYYGTGKWDVMGSGSWNNQGITPAHHNPYTKIYSFGWAKAKILTSNAAIKLDNAELNNDNYYRIDKASSNEFFLLENRQQLNFDSFIPGHGLIIYNVDGNFINANSNNINASSHQGMYPVCANATGNPPDFGIIDNSGLPFPGSGNKSMFTDETVPCALSWSGAKTNKPVTKISENSTDYTISFSFNVLTVAPTATTIAASGISNSSAILKAQVNAYNDSTRVSFEYGLTPDLGFTINPNPMILTGSLLTDLSVLLTDLKGNTKYFYRIKAMNSLGITYGDMRTFTTFADFIVPTLSTIPVSSITETTVITGGEIIAFGGAMITAKGVCWSTSTEPSITLDTKTLNGAGSNAFISNISGLKPGTTYHVRSFATSVAGTGYGPDVAFITNAVPVPLANTSDSIFQSGFFTRWEYTSTSICFQIDVATDETFKTIVTEYSDKDIGNNLNYFVTGLNPGTNYYYRIRAKTKNGISDYSNTILVKTLSDAPSSQTILYSVGDKKLIAFPNPVAISFKLKTNEVENCSAEVCIYNLSGLKVMQFQTENLKGEILKNIRVTNLNHGIYIVSVLLDNNKIYNTRIVVI
jgi:M6 family metalloprotease-like protein